MHDKELEGARAEQAKARASVMQKEKRIKKAEKTLEAKVMRHRYHSDSARADIFMVDRNRTWCRWTNK